MPGAKPNGPVTIRMFNVGFGDCFLLTFPYKTEDGGNRHLLIDFGSFPAPQNAPKLKERIAQRIRQICQGEKFAVVATHRHADHINGFGTNKQKTASGDIIASLKPEIVVQPWTEHPDAAQNAHKAPAFRAAALRFYHLLDAQQKFADAFVGGAGQLPRYFGKAVADQLRFEGENAVSNQDAVVNLMTMGKKKPKYVHAGSKSGLESFLPGVRIRVLGPPTLEEDPDIQKYASQSDEYWISRRQLALGAGGERGGKQAASKLFRRAVTVSVGRAPRHAKWFIARMRKAYERDQRGIVTILDDFMNNTSIILLFEVNGKKLLFPGDAQIENWAYAQKKYDALLSGVHVYKVGHHGSRNANPKSLWKKMTEGQSAVPAAQFTTLLSTMANVHGGEHGKPTEVPRDTLVEALKAKSHFHTTQDIPFGENATIQV